MAYIGRDPLYGAFEKQTLTADSSTTTFTLDYVVGSSSSILVSVAGVLQEPITAYSLGNGGGSIIFSEAPTTGDTVFIVFLGVTMETLTVGTGAITSQTELPTGAFTLNAKRGESSGSALFTIGLTTGSGAISIQTTRDEYKQGDQILVLGNTGAINVLLDITIIDPNGNVIKKIETFSDRFGVFKIDNFRIPTDGEVGVWQINAKSGGNFKITEFAVSGVDGGALTLFTDKSSYSLNELINISGSGARLSATVTLMIFDSEERKVDELAITSKSNGEYLTIWQIPRELEIGEYKITVDDGVTNASVNFSIN